MATIAEITNLFEDLAIVYPKQTVTEHTIVVYARYLADLDIGEIKVALDQHISTSPFFPTVADLRNAVFHNRELMQPTLTGDVAWGKVMRKLQNGDINAYVYCDYVATREYSGKPRLNWDDPLIHEACLAVGGYRYLTQMTNDTLMADRSHFVKVYNDLRAREAARAKLLPSTQAHLAQRLSSPEVIALPGRKEESDANAGRSAGAAERRRRQGALPRAVRPAD